MGVTSKVLSALRSLMTGFGMTDLEAAGSHMEIPSYKAGYLTVIKTWICPAPLLYVLLKRF